MGNELNYLYIGLFRTTELGLVEIQKEDTNYRRIEMGPGDWGLIRKDSVTNVVKITFPDVESTWGLITHFGVFDSLNNGELLATGALNNPEFVYEGCEIKFDTGKMEISLEALGIYDG